MNSCRKLWVEKLLDDWGTEPVNKLEFKGEPKLSIEENDYLQWVNDAVLTRELDHSQASTHLLESHSFDPIINRHLIFSYLIECLTAKSDDFELFFESVPHALKYSDEYKTTFFLADYPYLFGAIKCLSETADFPNGRRRLAAILRLWKIQDFEKLD